MPTIAPLPIVVLISGSGSNLQALIDQQKSHASPFEIKAVISNKQQAFGLERAKTAGIPAEFLDHTTFENRETYDQELIKIIEEHWLCWQAICVY